MKEAINKGYLTGKLEHQLQTKVNDAILKRVTAICDATGEERADWFRNLIIRELLIQEEQYNRMTKVWGDTKNTSTTSDYNVIQQKSPSAVTDEPNIQ
ncbi:hypothetical protein G9F32_02965 [Acinetobacter sp. 194]|uniref:hypothetical protein n=1 Tax=Acinetobacter shaoyimingii TaxID=2715164 RepID=UPI00140DC7B9|nr:hypothetical protein [Acinetobacter shaoyimingii]NHB56996.1 hypothetical protein [Acinetobacter shaoyimingii]